MGINKLIKSKGVAGLNVFLSVITMIFVTGILIMAFVLTGSQMETAVSNAGYTDPTPTILIIGNTTGAIDDAVTWFPIFIVIAAIVVIVLLIVMLIVALRGGGLMGSQGA